MSGEHVSVIKNTGSDKVKDVDLSGVFKEYSKVFLHPNGFIAVLGVSFEEVDKDRVVRLVLGG
jgi:hypothetical protein